MKIYNYSVIINMINYIPRKEDCTKIIPLIKRCSNINGRNTRGTTLLHETTQKNMIDAVELLINRGADMNVINFSGITVLACAVSRNEVDLARLLIENGASLTSTIHSLSLIEVACYNGSVKMLELLIEKGIDINAINNFNNTPLKLSIYYRKVEVILFLIENNANVSGIDLNGCLSDPLERYENGIMEQDILNIFSSLKELWTTKRHKIFPKRTRGIIKILVCLGYRHPFTVFPKDVLFYICQIVVKNDIDCH